MRMEEFRVFSRWSPVAALLLALLTFNLAAQAQESLIGSGAKPAATKSIFTRQPTPNPGDDQLLLAIAADSEQDVWVVGDFLSLNFNGQSWNSIPMVFPGGESSMVGVTAISPSDVWAVGSSLVNSTHLISVIEHYDGTQWTIVSSPQFATGSDLHAIKAFSANDIFAVGETNSDKQKGRPLVEHYDGNQWSVVPLPPLKTGKTAVLSAIGGLSHTDFWIAGATGPIFRTFGDPVVMHFDGQQFTQVPFPGTKLDIGGIAEIAANDAWIVGSNGSAMTAHWDGKAWTVVPSPGAGIFSGLTGVSAISSTDIWASGDIEDTKKGVLSFLYLIEHWDGKSWTISPIPATKGGFDSLFGVQAFPSGSVFVAGSALECAGNNCFGFTPAIFHTTQGK
jgi:hypothetical protein